MSGEEQKKKPFLTLLKETVLAKVHQNPELIVDGFFDTPRGNYRWLSNYHQCQIEWNGMLFPTVEHAYHAMKTLVKEEQERFTKNLDPVWAKKHGQTITLRPDWEVVKIECMEFCLRQKFKAGTELAEKLKATNPADLIETNWWNDKFWGVCVCPKCNNNGLNNLGKLLMKIRSDLLGENNNVNENIKQA